MFITRKITRHNLTNAQPSEPKTCLIARAAIAVVRKGVVVAVGSTAIEFSEPKSTKVTHRAAVDIDQPKATCLLIEKFDSGNRKEIKAGTPVRLNVPKRFLKPEFADAALAIHN